MTKSDSSFRCALALLVVMAVGSGLVVWGQVPQAVGSWASTGAVADSREGSASATLADGRTLIAGGYAAGIATPSVVIYNPLDNTFIAVGQMTGARVSHTATSLKDGRVLIAGGEIAGVVTADLEIFDPADWLVNHGWYHEFGARRPWSCTPCRWHGAPGGRFRWRSRSRDRRGLRSRDGCDDRGGGVDSSAIGWVCNTTD